MSNAYTHQLVLHPWNLMKKEFAWDVGPTRQKERYPKKNGYVENRYLSILLRNTEESLIRIMTVLSPLAVEKIATIRLTI